MPRIPKTFSFDLITKDSDRAFFQFFGLLYRIDLRTKITARYVDSDAGNLNDLCE